MSFRLLLPVVKSKCSSQQNRIFDTETQLSGNPGWLLYYWALAILNQVSSSSVSIENMLNHLVLLCKEFI